MSKKSVEKFARNANIAEKGPVVTIFAASLFVITKIIIIFAPLNLTRKVAKGKNAPETKLLKAQTTI